MFILTRVAAAEALSDGLIFLATVKEFFLLLLSCLGLVIEVIAITGNLSMLRPLVSADPPSVFSNIIASPAPMKMYSVRRLSTGPKASLQVPQATSIMQRGADAYLQLLM